LQIKFTKGSGKYDEMRIARDGVSETVACPKQGIIPHDMVHFIVESTLDRRGFLSRVRSGESADFRMAAEPESDGVERLVEVIQGDAWSGSNAAAEDILDLYRITCAARQCPPLPIDDADIAAIRHDMRELDTRWQALAIGQSIEVMFHQGREPIPVQSEDS
jgi:hypothetical protein